MAEQRTESERIIAIEATYEHLATKADVANLRTDIANLRTDLKSDDAALTTELKDDIGNLRTDIANLRTDLKSDDAALTTELKDDIGNLRNDLTDFKSSTESTLRTIRNLIILLCAVSTAATGLGAFLLRTAGAI